jgi:NADH pyrophosphatase NudC (nudix superfamily)
MDQRLLPENQFKHCPRCGSPALTSSAPKRLDCSACGLEFYVNVACAVAAFVADSQGRLLLVRRANDPGKGLLDLPGGFADAGESGEEVAVREVREETGITIRDVRYLMSTPNRYIYKEVLYHTLDLFYTAEADDIHSARALDEATEVVFRLPSELADSELAFTSVQKALAAYRSIPR